MSVKQLFLAAHSNVYIPLMKYFEDDGVCGLVTDSMWLDIFFS